VEAAGSGDPAHGEGVKETSDQSCSEVSDHIVDGVSKKKISKVRGHQRGRASGEERAPCSEQIGKF